MHEFNVRKDYYNLIVETEHALHQESVLYYAYLDAKKNGHYFKISLMPWQLEEFYHRIHEYIEYNRENGNNKMIRTAHRLINDIVGIIGDPKEASHS